MVNLKENKIMKLIVCIAIVLSVFCTLATPVSASEVYSKTIKKAAGVWSGTAKHRSKEVKVTYSCRRHGANQAMPGYVDYCTDSTSLRNHRARIQNSKGTAYAKKKSQGIGTTISKPHYGKSTNFQSEYFMK